LPITRPEVTGRRRRLGAAPIAAPPPPARGPPDSIASDLLEGGAAIAAYLGFSLSATFRALEKGDVPARKRGSIWVASKVALTRYYQGGVGAGNAD
jgi:hypothetical protein